MKRMMLWLGCCVALVVVWLPAGCAGDFVNVFASHGGTSVREPGTFSVLFVNNTPYRAAFTVGSYDQTDQDTVPDAQQFTLTAEGTNLDAGETSDVLTIDCAQVLAIGSQRLLYFIEENLAYGVEVEEASFVEGVAFYDMSEDAESDEDGCPPAAPAFEALLDVDFPCGSLVIIRFEHDDTGSQTFTCNGESVPYEFRVDFEVVIPEP